MSNQSQLENTFNIDLSKKPPWQTFDELQFRLHVASMTPEHIQYNDIDHILNDIRLCVTQHVLPDSMYKTIGIMTLHLLLLLGMNLISNILVFRERCC